MQLMGFKLQSYGVSDIGLVRTNNEDMWKELTNYQFFALADGMGGHRAGEVAAKEAVTYLCESIEDIMADSSQPSIETLSEELNEAIIGANAHVFRLAKQNEDYSGMGTTLCCLLLQNDTLIYAHVGDSRIYRFRKKPEGLKRLTTDHSLRSELIAKGELDEKDAATFPYKNIITRAIGTNAFVEPEVNTTKVLPDDIYFMCSDGLTDYVDEKKISTILENSPNIKAACNDLVKAANANGGNDNITVVMVQVIA